MSDEKRAWVHGLWAGVADAWIARADYLDERGAAVTKAIIDGSALRPTDAVLALADGPGGLALAAAASGGRVVSSDVVPALVAAAAARADAMGLRNVSARVVDLEAIDAQDGEFDVVISREGLMFALDPARAFAEIARVLSPGGRLAAAVWAAPAHNPWLSIVTEAVSDIAGHPVPPPGMPGPFALGDESRLRALTTDAGLVGVRIDHVSVPFHASSFEAWWAHTSALAGPVANIVAGFDDAQTSRLEAVLRAGTAKYSHSDGLTLPGLSLIVIATKP